MPPKEFTDIEVRNVMLAALACNNAQGIELDTNRLQEETSTLLNWIRDAQVSHVLANLILEGKVVARVVDGKLQNISLIENAEEAIHNGTRPSQIQLKIL